ncbi:MAG: PEP-CTERM sorting domain-containing protein [Planctomycetales bacterium]|nr:PEP-CTERM sorting domain-containing protein [Planctomycetales bacterium]
MVTKRGFHPAVELMLVMGFSASAGLIDLTTAGATGSVNGATFTQHTFDLSTGTGVFEPFVRLQGKALQQGYNTSGELEWETKSGLWTHPIQLSDIPVVGNFYEFRLDINENKSQEDRYLSLDELKIHVVSSAVGGGLTGYDTNPSFGSPDWELGDNWIKLNYALDPGSGNGDMVALIPISALGTDGLSYVYLYSKFGATKGFESDAGFEEWGVGGVSGPVPEPTTLLLLGLGALCTRSCRNNRRLAR